MTHPAQVSTDEWWSVDGVPLNTHAWSTTTVGGQRYAVPLMRGGDMQVAYRPGEVWLPKMPGVLNLSLQMSMWGADPDTGAAVPDPRRRWNDSWAYLRSLFWGPDRQFVLARRWLRTDPDTGGPVIAYAEARGQLDGDMAPSMVNRTKNTFTVDIKVADGFFFGPPQTSDAIAPGETVTVVNPGDYTAAWSGVYVDLVGPLTAPRLTNLSRSPNPACWIAGSVPAGATLSLDVDNYVARTVVAGSTTGYRSGEVGNSGIQPWMALLRGENRLRLTGSGSGYARVRFQPPYL